MAETLASALWNLGLPGGCSPGSGRL